MTKESKLALIMSFVLILVVGVLISDHFSHAGSAALGVVEPDSVLPETTLPERESAQRDSGSMLQELSRSFETMRAPELAQPALSTESDLRDDPIVIVNAPSEMLERDTATPWCTVREGDSLYAIARRELGDGERWREIQTLNSTKLGGGTTLRAGMTLELPIGARGESKATQTPLPTPASALGDTPLRTHTVEQGDALGLIAQRYLGTVRRMNEIVELNGLDDADDIRIGMTLKIPSK